MAAHRTVYGAGTAVGAVATAAMLAGAAGELAGALLCAAGPAGWQWSGFEPAPMRIIYEPRTSSASAPGSERRGQGPELLLAPAGGAEERRLAPRRRHELDREWQPLRAEAARQAQRRPPEQA